MDKTEKLEKLKDIIRVYLPEDVSPEEITTESTFVGQLNINSAHMVDIVLDVEDAYDIVLENEDLENMRSVDDALRIIENKMGDKE
ncbi:phosphopantetheine-binding protein [Flavobacteriaceae bacterium F89]|uniref:Acyl carrier protein n=1 Tax=Cerina litoralis TaxID=2874477 RepID=A0AAE3EX25_9FLAO|nr:phosphopantetheine-binding protein [Cerina litoralis]MCG2461302.1 phosphopantetheine-binding protein [Cerina litoralis]